MDKCLHVFLHCSARGWRDLVVLHANRSGWHLIQALVDDAKRLTKLLHSDEVSIVTVAVDTDRYVEFNLVIGVVGLRLAYVPGDTTATKHGSREAVVESVSSGNNTDVLCAALPDAVVGQ